MRILSPEKKYLYYLMISQLHEDGYTQQALQLEVSTIHSSGAVKASDKLSRLFSSCLSSVQEATAHFNKGSTSYNVAGRKRHNQSAANIRAANLANLAKRRRTAGSIDSTSIFQDSIKKCVKLVTNDLQKATSDISSISPGPSPLSKPNVSKQLAQKHTMNKNKLSKSPAARQLFSNPTSSKAPLSKTSPRGLPSVTNSFLKGISLLKTSNMPSVTPYTGSSALPGQTPPKSQAQPANPRAVTAQILAQQRMTSDSASVVRMTKNITNEPVIIDIEAPSSSKSMPTSTGGLQLTQPRSAPLQAVPGIAIGGHKQIPKQTQPLQLTTPKPLLSVGSPSASALKSLVNKINKKPVLSIQKKTMAQKPSLEVVVLDDAVKTASTPTPSMPTTSPQQRPGSEASSSGQTTPTTSIPSIPPPIISSASTSNVLSALGLQPSRQASKEAPSPVSSPVSSTASPVPPLSHLPVPPSPSISSAGSAKSPQIGSPGQSSAHSSSSMQEPESSSQSNGLKSPCESSPSPALSAPASEASKDSTAEDSAVVKEETTSAQPQIACVQCDTPEDQKYTIPEQEAKKPTAEVSNTSSDTDFPSEIFAEDPPSAPPTSSAAPTSSESEPFKSPTSLSDALHAASDALLDHT